MRTSLRPIVFILALATSFTAARAETPPPPAAIPADLDGSWLGEIRHGDESSPFALEFARQPDGRVVTRLWLPNINAYGTEIGPLAFADSKFSVAALGAPLTLDRDALSGHAFTPDLAFTLHRGGPLPAELALPADVPTGPEPAWVFRAGAPFWNSPVVADGVAYLGDTAGKFHAIHTVDGTAAWTFDAATPLYGNAAITADGVYFAGDEGHLFKLARATGAELWRADIGGGTLKRSLPSPTAPEWDPLAAAPVVSENAVFIGSADGTLHALGTADGKPLWSFKTAGKLRAAVLVAGERVYVGSMDHFVYALDRRTGALIWRFDTGSSVTTAPVLADGRIVIGTRDQALLFALDAADGHKTWSVYYWLS